MWYFPLETPRKLMWNISIYKNICMWYKFFEQLQMYMTKKNEADDTGRSRALSEGYLSGKACLRCWVVLLCPRVLFFDDGGQLHAKQHYAACCTQLRAAWTGRITGASP